MQYLLVKKIIIAIFIGEKNNYCNIYWGKIIIAILIGEKIIIAILIGEKIIIAIWKNIIGWIPVFYTISR